MPNELRDRLLKAIDEIHIALLDPWWAGPGPGEELTKMSWEAIDSLAALEAALVFGAHRPTLPTPRT